MRTAVLAFAVGLVACEGETADSRSAGGDPRTDPLAAAPTREAVRAATRRATMTLVQLPADVEAIGLGGDSLRAPTFDDATRQALDSAIADAVATRELEPGNAEATIWLGRRLAYRGRYRDAIAVFSDGIAGNPDDPRLYRHRGHRWLTVRQTEAAVADLAWAARLAADRPRETEPDGQPNAAGIPLGNLHFNIWYHLGLAHYVRGDFPRALAAYDSCLTVSDNPDLQVATTYWRQLTLRQLGRTAEADSSITWVSDTLTLLENDVYRDLVLLFRGVRAPDSLLTVSEDGTVDVGNATAAYGVGAWHVFNGRREEGEALWRRIVASSQWAAFGTLAAEAALARDAGP